MKALRPRLEILARNKQILNSISTNKTLSKHNSIRAKGYILFAEAKEHGFKKVGWDVYQRDQDIDAGQIWSVESVDGDKWLVCYTDANDKILRNIANEAFSLRQKITKVAQKNTEPILGYAFKPGDLAEITPNSNQSVHLKYEGQRGIVTAAVPDRSQLTFGDGSSMWFENNQLTSVVDAKEMEIGDNVRMFSRVNVKGKITKISSDGKYISFQNSIGQDFHARRNQVVKDALFVLHTDPYNQAETKSIKEIMKYVYSPEAGQPQPTENAPSPGAGAPPAIKQTPTALETERGTAIPTADIMGGPAPNMAGPPAGGAGGMGGGGGIPTGDISMGIPMSADKDKAIKTGRKMNVGDSVQKKSTGEKGTIVDIQFDRKLGKFYLIDFGSQTPETIYDTDLMKLKDMSVEVEPMLFPTETTPGPTRFKGQSKRAILGPEFDNIKQAALEFVSGMVSQSLKNHEAQFPGQKTPPELETALTKQAIVTYLSKYMPPDMQQVLAYEEKNEFSEWLQNQMGNTTEDAPTAQEFAVGENTVMPAQRSPQEIATDVIRAHINSHIQIKRYSPAKFASPISKNRFLHEAVNYLVGAGIESKTAQFISQSIITNKLGSGWIKHTLGAQFAYSPERIEQLIEVAEQKLARSIFTTPSNEKYALDLPGMETLRGGGGGYPGGQDPEPMSWQVGDPTGQQDPAMVEKALEEQLMNQAKPFDSAAPKINIELDTDNKRIVIDYNQEEEPVLPIDGTVPGQPLPTDSPNMPSPTGPAGPKPGQTSGPGGNEGNFSNMDIPVNF